MGQSIGPPAATRPGRVSHGESGAVVNISQDSGRMTHRISELGYRADYPISFQIGAGKVGHSYIARIGQYLLQSPVSFYTRYGWDISPGFQDALILDFDRVLGDKCLFCHSGNAEFSGSRRLAPDAQIGPIDCARCHGDTQEHLRHPSRLNIVNPARLDIRARDSVCEQCHLEGVARILNPGRSLSDFHAGTELENTLSIYVYDRRQAGAKAVSQVEQLALSRCARESGGKLWCGTCHDPHGLKAANESQRVSAVCNSCHAGLPAAGHPAHTSDCIGCHMPRLSPHDVAHAASTDHRILARPSGESGGEAGSVMAWHEPASEIRQRNLGLAELEASGLPELHSLGDSAGNILDGLPAEQREHDPVVLAALADLALAHGNLEKSERLFRSASELAPANAGYLMYLGIALKQKGKSNEASNMLQKAIVLDASLQRAYLELSALDAQQGKVQDAAAVLNEYLKWNPQSIVVRSALQGLH